MNMEPIRDIGLLTKDTCVFVDYPARIARVVETGIRIPVQVEENGKLVMRNRDAVRVVVATIQNPIKGIVTRKQAASMALVAKPQKWSEIWLENDAKVVGPVSRHGQTVIDVTDNPTIVIRVHEVIGIDVETKGWNPRNTVVGGAILSGTPKELEDIQTTMEAEEAEEQEAEIERRDLQDVDSMNFTQLRAEALRRGVDVSGIGGAGAVQKMRDLLRD